MKNKPCKNVVVMGAGPAGLSAAYQLSKNDIKVKVFEAQNQVGGISKTIVKNGFRFDLGGHRWFTKIDELDKLVKKLLGRQLIEVYRTSRIFFDGRYFDYPIKISNVLKGLGFWKSTKVVLSYLLVRIKYRLNPKPLKTFEDWTIANFGYVLYSYFFKTYTEKLWGIPCRQIGAQWATQRIKGLSLSSAIRNALIPAKSKPKTLIDKFLYPKFGIGRICERLAEEIKKHNNQIALMTTVKQVNHKNGKIISVIVEEKTGGAIKTREIAADQFISSIPLTQLIRILTSAAPQAIIDASKKLTYRALITVHIIIDRPQITSDTWVYIHDSAAGLGRLHEPKNWSKYMVANQNQSSLVCELWCQENDEVWRKNDSQLIKLVMKDLTEVMNFITIEDVVDAFVVRTSKAYPVYKIGYQKPLKIIQEYLSRFENLQLVGRYGTYKYNNMDHSILGGLWAAKNIILGKRIYDLEQINADLEYHEEKQN